MRTFHVTLLLLGGSALMVFAGQPALIAAIVAMVRTSPEAEHLENSSFAAALGAQRATATPG